MAIRVVSESDAGAVGGLIGELGYLLPREETARRIAMVLRAADHRAWVYEDDGAVVGILHAFYRPAFDNPPEVMVQALMVRRLTSIEGRRRSADAGRRELGA